MRLEPEDDYAVELDGGLRNLDAEEVESVFFAVTRQALEAAHVAERQALSEESAEFEKSLNDRNAAIQQADADQAAAAKRASEVHAAASKQINAAHAAVDSQAESILKRFNAGDLAKAEAIAQLNALAQPYS